MKKDNQELYSKHKYSLVLLNWKRPNNVIKIINTMNQYSCIDEIIVSNGNIETLLDLNIPKTTFYDDSGYMNDKYGLDLRFINGIRAKNENIIVMDDDLFISDNELMKIIIEFEKNPNRIVGIFGRDSSSNSGYKYGNVYGEVDIILTRLLIVKKRLCHLFFICKPMIEDFYKNGQPYGNGEDIFLSFIGSLYYDCRHYALKNIKHIELDDVNAISSNDDHLIYRKRFCKYLEKMKDELYNLINSFHNI
jgi:hypothetical protein